MKNKKKLIKKISAVLCALVVVLATFGVSLPFYASDFSLNELAYMNRDNLCKDDVFNYEMPSMVSKYPYYIVTKYLNNEYYTVWCFDDVPSLIVSGNIDYSTERSLVRVKLPLGVKYAYHYYPNTNKWVSWADPDPNYNYEIGSLFVSRVDGSFASRTMSNYFVCSNTDIYISDTDFCFYSLGPSYNSSLGYLQNVHVNHVFEDVPLGENVGEKYTSRWYYDALSTTGIDITNGDYMINYYQERWIVTGYGVNDVVRKSNRYLLGTYIVQNGYIQTYSEDVESTLIGQGYEEPSMFDLFPNKFITTHYYFQIVDARNNQVGGLLHIYLTDDNGKFGVEHMSETLDNDGNYDEEGYKDFIDEDKITTDDTDSGFDELEQDNEQTLEEWLEDLNGLDSDGLDDMDGAENLGNSLQAYAGQIGNVTKGVGALFGALPDWILGLLGVSFACLFVLIVVKVARG